MFRHERPCRQVTPITQSMRDWPIQRREKNADLRGLLWRSATPPLGNKTVCLITTSKLGESKSASSRDEADFEKISKLYLVLTKEKYYYKTVQSFLSTNRYRRRLNKTRQLKQHCMTGHDKRMNHTNA